MNVMENVNYNLKNKSLFRKVGFIVGFLLLFINISGLNGVFHFYTRYLIVGIITLPLTYFLLKINPFKKIGFFSIFLFFYLAMPNILFGLYNGEKVPGVFFFLIYTLASVAALIMHFYGYKKIILPLYTIIFIVTAYNHDNMINYYYDDADESLILNKEIPKITLTDVNGNERIIKGNGKIQVIDIWSNSCSACIKAFPKFEQVYQKYKHDSQVEVYAINIKLKDFDAKRTAKYLDSYNFPNFFTEASIKEKLKFSEVPNYMIVSKKGTIKYFGTLNINDNETYNNIYDLIENEKNSLD